MQLIDTFSALGNETRFFIVEKLLKEGELAAGEFKNLNNISAPAISRHFKILREAGIINQRVDKQQRKYSVKPEVVQAISEWSLSYRDFWMSGFERLELALSEDIKDS